MKPTVILAPHWRRMDELFSSTDLQRLRDDFEVVWGQDEPIPPNVLEDALPRAFALVSATPLVDQAMLDRATQLKVVAEVSGAFPNTVDYAACAARSVEVLCCAPGFRQSVAEMAAAMALSGARGLVQEHERFRRGEERWLEDNDGEDFTLYGANLGFIGYGSIARETHRLLRPFNPRVKVFDPWLPKQAAAAEGVSASDFDSVMAESQCVFVAAAPTKENRGLVDARALSLMPRGALLVLISRAHLVDFDALIEAARTGAIRAAVDVFPSEPVAPDHPLRKVDNIILSPHRAAAVPGGRQLIGNMLVADLQAMIAGKAPSQLQRAANMPVESLAGVGNAQEVANMAKDRH